MVAFTTDRPAIATSIGAVANEREGQRVVGTPGIDRVPAVSAVSVPMLVPFTTTLAPGNGLPSAVEVTVPVTRTGVV